MTKSELVKKIRAKFPDIELSYIERMIDTIFNEFSGALASDNRIEIRGLGSFSIRTRKARKAVNPKTNKEMNLAERKVVYFRSGKLLNNMVNS